MSSTSCFFVLFCFVFFLGKAYPEMKGSGGGGEGSGETVVVKLHSQRLTDSGRILMEKLKSRV